MVKVPPKEPEFLSWLFVVLWVGVIFVTVPFARQMQVWVADSMGREVFTYVVIGVVALVGVGSVLLLWRARSMGLSRLIWIGAVAAIYIGYTLALRDNPEEALHFLQYGFLGWLLFRALSHRVRDGSIYLAAIVLGAAVGILDETWQWIVPGRVWDLRDIWINILGVALMQVAIAKGGVPAEIGLRPKAAGLRMLCRAMVVVLVIFGLNLLNTPPRVLWYTAQVPALSFLIDDGRVMFEYGYMHQVPDVGDFRSRFDVATLRQLDQDRAVEAAGILEEYKDPDLYLEFLRAYSPYTDPFVHEARVHLFRRDRYLRKAFSEETLNDEALRREYATIAYRENQILQHSFPNTLAQSSYPWAPDQAAALEPYVDFDAPYLSKVSRRTVTNHSEAELFGLLLLVMGFFVVADILLGRRDRSGEKP